MVKEIFIAAGALFALAAGPVVEKEAQDAEVEQEREISLDEVPEAARIVILEEAGEHQVLEVEEIIVEGEVFFEAEWIAGGKEVEITVTRDGQVAGREVEDIDDEDAGEDEAD